MCTSRGLATLALASSYVPMSQEDAGMTLALDPAMTSHQVTLGGSQQQHIPTVHSSLVGWISSAVFWFIEKLLGRMSEEEVPVDENSEVFKLAPFNPSSAQIQEKALKLLQLTPDDVLFDLGCGDGRFLIEAAKQHPGLRCVGVEVDPIFATRAKQAVLSLSGDLQGRVDIREQDALKIATNPSPTTVSPGENTPDDVTALTFIDHASALYLFVLPKGIEKLMPLLESLVHTRKAQRRSLRVLSYMFQIRSWEPTHIDKTSKAGCPIYLYDFPRL
eukprot:Nitzschia sp. Nitz4//scaffold112_size70979//68542//69366//NITZ4_005913-RA/size70979-processed-gene-0.112-mRNA-1//1//CDS//3329533298//2066//frame0